MAIEVKKDKKVLLIDVADALYFQMFVKSARKIMDVDIVTKYGSSYSDANEFFYYVSEKMPRNGIVGKIRKIVRGVEYFIGYMRVLHLVKTNNYAVVHIHWAVIPKLDTFFFRIIKRFTPKLIYTAHDVIPHNPTPQKIRQNAKLYTIPDKLVVHGQYCYDELKECYPGLEKKSYIQYHGVYDKKKTIISDTTKNKHSQLIDNSEKLVVGIIGQISKHKGIDTVIDVWEKNFKHNENIFLLIAGKTIDEYKSEFEKIADRINSISNIYFYNERFDDEEEALFYSTSDIVVLPYKTASMSGVFFSAAQYEKTLLSTEVGCLKQYIDLLRKDIYVCDPNYESISKSLNDIISISDTKKVLKSKGIHFSHGVYEIFSWDMIIRDLKEKCYEL